MSTLENLTKLLLAEVGANNGRVSLTPDENLLAQGIIDSMGIIKLIASMEKAFGIQVMDDEVVPENFQNLNSLARFVDEKMQNK
jgi:acyl carrier protein